MITMLMMIWSLVEWNSFSWHQRLMIWPLVEWNALSWHRAQWRAVWLALYEMEFAAALQFFFFVPCCKREEDTYKYIRGRKVPKKAFVRQGWANVVTSWEVGHECHIDVWVVHQNSTNYIMYGDNEAEVTQRWAFQQVNVQAPACPLMHAPCWLRVHHACPLMISCPPCMPFNRLMSKAPCCIFHTQSRSTSPVVLVKAGNSQLLRMHGRPLVEVRMQTRVKGLIRSSMSAVKTEVRSCRVWPSSIWTEWLVL